jgi:N-acetylmuramoyl-L-alanine amidase
VKSLVIFFFLLSFPQSLCARSDPPQVVKRVYLKKEKERCFLCVDFDEDASFTPRVHILPNGVKVLLSFDREVAAPKAKRISHPLIKGYFFEKFSSSSLMFVAALKENVSFVSKKYDNHSIKIGFEIRKKHTIVIDAGHGGKDPGTKGVAEDYEKNIALVTAIELKNSLTKSGKYRVILTRDSDVFTSIDARMEKIRLSNGDFLISLHTDSNNDKNLRGMSIYTLPNLDDVKHADNASDSGYYYKLLSRSRKFAESLMGYIPNACRIKNRPCRNSELKILKANMPAVLVELGCISNKIDNELLHSQNFRAKTISAIGYALDNYFEKEKR